MKRHAPLSACVGSPEALRAGRADSSLARSRSAAGACWALVEPPVVVCNAAAASRLRRLGLVASLMGFSASSGGGGEMGSAGQGRTTCSATSASGGSPRRQVTDGRDGCVGAEPSEKRLRDRRGGPGAAFCQKWALVIGTMGCQTWGAAALVEKTTGNRAIYLGFLRELLRAETLGWVELPGRAYHEGDNLTNRKLGGRLPITKADI